MFGGLTKLGLFTIRPSIGEESGRIVIRNSMITRILSCFTHVRKVEFCPFDRVVRYRMRTFWFLSAQVDIPFTEVSHMEFLSGSMETGYDKSAGDFDPTNTPRNYSLALATHHNDLVEICTFSGGDAIDIGPEHVETEAGEAISIVQRLSTILDIKLRKETVNRKQIFERCPKCRRKVSKHASLCLYCRTGA
ncbi:MAG: hypothetical protein ACPGVU_05535 [Limisphaerales bacterium]